MCHFVPFSHIPLKRDNGLIISPAIEGGSVQMHLLSSQLGGARALKTHFNEIWRELLATNQCIIDNRDLCADYNDCYGWWSECAEYFREYPLYLAIHNHLYLPLSSFQWMILSLTISVSWYHGSRATGKPPEEASQSQTSSWQHLYFNLLYKTECNHIDFIATVH